MDAMQVRNKISHSQDIIDSTKETLSGNPAREEFLRRTDEAATWEQKFDLLGEHYRRFIALINHILVSKKG